MRKILYLLAIIAVAGCQKNEPDLLMGKNASERMQQNKENLKKLNVMPKATTERRKNKTQI